MVEIDEQNNACQVSCDTYLVAGDEFKNQMRQIGEIDVLQSVLIRKNISIQH